MSTRTTKPENRVKRRKADVVAEPSSYKLAKPFGLMGSFASGIGDLSENAKRYLKIKLRRPT